MKRVILHIGTEKTATKSLQQFFYMNHREFEKAGVWYPCSEELDYCYGNGHFPLPASLFEACPEFIPPEKHFDPDTLFARLKRDIQSREEPTTLLSAEHFSSRCSQADHVRQIGKHLQGLEVRIIVYVRPQHELLVSAYSTYLKNGGRERLNRLATAHCLKPGLIYFDYLQMMQHWGDVFGQDKITVRVFQKDRMKNRNIFDDVLSVLGMARTASLQMPGRLNPSISNEAAEFIHLANRHFPVLKEDNRVEWELGNQFRAEALSVLSTGGPLRHLLSRELKSDIHRFYADSNRVLARQFRPDLDGRLFLDEPDSPISENMEGQAQACFGPDFVKWVVNIWKQARRRQAGSK